MLSQVEVGNQMPRGLKGERRHADGVGMAITVRGWGKSRPVAPNTRPNGADDPEGRQKNRRVEITVRT